MYAVDTYRQPRNWLPVLLVVLALVAGGFVAVNYRNHSILRHGFDAYQVNACLDRNGPAQVWQSRNVANDQKYFQTCVLPDGRHGLRVIQCQAGRWVERTAFVVGNGTEAELINHLSGKAVRFGGWLSEVCR